MKYIKKITESIENKDIVIIETDDWSGLYYNGELISQGHEIRWIDVIERIFKVKIGVKFIDSEEFEEMFGSSCPQTLDDVKMKFDVKKYNL